MEKIAPFDAKNLLILAQNQSSIALGLTELSFKGRTPSKKAIVKRFIEIRDEIFQDAKEKYVR